MRNIFLLLFVVSMSACLEEDVVFTEPHPVETKPLNKFPKKIRGNYKNVDTTFVYDVEISKRMICNHEYYSDVIDFNSLSIPVLNKLINVGDSTSEVDQDGVKLNYTNQGDSVLLNFTLTDTIFAISDTNVLKKIGKNYFVNLKIDKDKWVIGKLVFEKKKFTYYILNRDSVNAHYNDFSDGDFIVNPLDKKEFKRLWESTQLVQGVWKKID